jgi:hypothetical protein
LSQHGLDGLDDVAHVLYRPPLGGLVEALAEAADVDGANEIPVSPKMPTDTPARPSSSSSTVVANPCARTRSSRDEARGGM